MNVIEIPEPIFNKLYESSSKKMTPTYLMRFLNFRHLTFDNYYIQIINPKDKKPTRTIYLIEIINKQEMFGDILEEDINDVSEEVTVVMKLTYTIGENIITGYTIPQIVTREGNTFFDIYYCPSKKDAHLFYRKPQYLYATFVKMGLAILDSVESQLKKNRKVIKKMMPTPEEKETIKNEDVYYESLPVRIKDISVRYIYEPHNMRKYNRHCEKWGVRGHYRHYKNGKVVFIKPYSKGKGLMKDTKYILNFTEDKHGDY